MSVPENLGANKVVGHVFASDFDSGRYGQIRYTLSKKNKQKVMELFKVNSKTGTVTLQKSLDREIEDDRYNFIYSASQSIPSEIKS